MKISSCFSGFHKLNSIRLHNCYISLNITDYDSCRTFILEREKKRGKTFERKKIAINFRVGNKSVPQSFRPVSTRIISTRGSIFLRRASNSSFFPFNIVLTCVLRMTCGVVTSASCAGKKPYK